MRTLEIKLIIPTSKRACHKKILEKFIDETEGWMGECDRWGYGDAKTIADRLGFGGNVISVEAMKKTNEICL